MPRGPKKPPSPTRWKPPRNVRAARRKRRLIILLLGSLVAGGIGSAIALRERHSEAADSPFMVPASAHEPLASSGGASSRPQQAPTSSSAPVKSSNDGLPSGRFTCTVAHITDGDTFRCAEQDATGREIRVRVSGLDAREKDGTCAPGHPCASAPAQAATAELSQLIQGQVLTCEPVGETYHRVAAWCTRRDGTDVSCAMMASGTVALWPKYWGSHRC